SGAIAYLELAEDGSGALRTSFAYGVLGCGVDVLHADFGAGLFSMDQGFGAGLFRYSHPDPDHLVITNKANAMISFERVTEVPETAKCSELSSVDTATDIRPAAGYWSGLAYQSSSALWYADNDGILHSVNPATSVVTPANGNTNGSNRY